MLIRWPHRASENSSAQWQNSHSFARHVGARPAHWRARGRLQCNLCHCCGRGVPETRSVILPTQDSSWVEDLSLSGLPWPRTGYTKVTNLKLNGHADSDPCELEWNLRVLYPENSADFNKTEKRWAGASFFKKKIIYFSVAITWWFWWDSLILESTSTYTD